MGDRMNVWMGAGVGALVGAAVGYLFFTERGALARRDLAARVGEATDHLTRVQGLATQLRDASTAGLATVSRLFSEETPASQKADVPPPSPQDVEPGPRLH